MEQFIYTAKDVSKLLGVGMNKTYELLASGEIPTKKIGRKYLISKVMFEKWLNDAFAITQKM